MIKRIVQKTLILFWNGLIIWQIEKLFKQVNVVIIHKVYN